MNIFLALGESECVVGFTPDSQTDRHLTMCRYLPLPVVSPIGYDRMSLRFSFTTEEENGCFPFAAAGERERVGE